MEAFPSIKVAAPVACRVMKSYLPAVLPIGATCLLFPYHEKEATRSRRGIAFAWEVKKFVFDGSEDYLELAQAAEFKPTGFKARPSFTTPPSPRGIRSWCATSRSIAQEFRLERFGLGG